MVKEKKREKKEMRPNTKGRFGSTRGRVMCVSLSHCSDCSDCCVVVQNDFSVSRFPFSFLSFLKQPEAISEDERSGGGRGPGFIV